MMQDKKLGIATAYGYAKSKGYTGTEEEFAQLMADYAEVGEDARSAANAAQNSAAAAATAEINAAASEGQAQAIADGLDTRLDSQDAAIAAIRAAVGSPLVANTAAAMTDQNKIYVYTGDESGFTAGNWYYYDGAAWASGGVYNAVAVETDTTLRVSGVPADAKVTGDEIESVKSPLSELIDKADLYSSGNYIISLNGTQVTVSDGQFYLTSSMSAYDVYVAECVPGDAFIVNGTGGSGNARLWGFVESFSSSATKANIVSVCSATASAAGLNNAIMYVPDGAAWAIFHINNGGAVYKVKVGLINYVESVLSPVRNKAAQVDDVKDSLFTAVPAGYAEYIYGNAVETNSGKDFSTHNAQSGGSAYWNGVSLPNNSRVTGIALSSNCTATDFQLFFFDTSWNLLHSTDVLTPTVTDHKFYLSTPYNLPNGGQVLIAFRNLSGTYYYTILDSATSKEYVRSTSTLQNSTVKVCVDIIYEVAESIEFVEFALPKIPLDSMPIPRCYNADGQYTLVGRWFDWTVDNVAKKAVNCGGQSILFKTHGASEISISWGVRLAMSTDPYYAVSVDGGTWTRYAISTDTISLPDSNDHFVWIVLDGINLTASNSANRWDGGVICYLDNISVDAGTMIAVEPQNKKILFVGDSIVEGINVLGSADNSTVYSAVNEFSYRTARKLNAFPILCGYGGTTTWSGVDWVRYNKNGVAVNEIRPDIILIEYGYNDSTLISQGTKTVAEFIEIYTQLINILKVQYPGVPILCMIPFKQSLATYIRQVAALFTFCHVIETSGYDVTYTDTAHPNVAGAESAAEHLSNDIANLFGSSFFVT